MSKRAKGWLAAAASLILIGCAMLAGVMTVLKWDLTRLSTVGYETTEYEIVEAYKHISIVTDTADIVFVPSENAKTSVVCRQQKGREHLVTVQDDILAIELADTRKWYEQMEINFGTPEITVKIPSGEYGDLLVTASTGDIHMEQVCAGTLALSVSTGDITVSDVNCQGDIQIHVSTGRTSITDAKCQNVISRGSTGDLSLNNVIAAEKLSVQRSTGDIRLSRCDAGELLLQTDTGDVTGSLLSEKIFLATADTGRVEVPQTAAGGRCEIMTNTGDIRLCVEP